MLFFFPLNYKQLSLHRHWVGLEAEKLKSREIKAKSIDSCLSLRRNELNQISALSLSHVSSGYPWFIVCVCVCVWHMRVGGSWSRWSTLSCLRQSDVGSRRRSACRLGCCFSSGSLAHFLCVQLRCRSSFCVFVLPLRNSLDIQAAVCQRPSQQAGSLSVLYFNLCSLTPSRLVLQPTPLCLSCRRDPIPPRGIDEVHFILPCGPVW